MNRVEFLEKINNFLEKHNVSITALGSKSVKEPGFVTRVRGGSEIREKTQEKVLNWMADYEKKAASNGDN